MKNSISANLLGEQQKNGRLHKEYTAIVNHKDNASGVPIQISVYDDHIEIFNIGKWPEQLSLNH